MGEKTPHDIADQGWSHVAASQRPPKSPGKQQKLRERQGTDSSLGLRDSLALMTP